MWQVKFNGIKEVLSQKELLKKFKKTDVPLSIVEVSDVLYDKGQGFFYCQMINKVLSILGDFNAFIFYFNLLIS